MMSSPQSIHLPGQFLSPQKLCLTSSTIIGIDGYLKPSMSVLIPFSGLASGKEWTATVFTKDENDYTIHSGTTSFTLLDAETKEILLALSAAYSQLIAEYSPVRDSVAGFELLVDDIKVAKTSFDKQSIIGQAVSLSFD